MKQDATDRSIPAQKRLLELTQKRLERFATFLPKFLVNDDPDTIHDLRVLSRRLQQTLRSIDSRSKPRASRKIIKILRRVRRALGSLRNLDVNRDLVQDRLEKTPSPMLRGPSTGRRTRPAHTWPGRARIPAPRRRGLAGL